MKNETYKAWLARATPEQLTELCITPTHRATPNPKNKKTMKNALNKKQQKEVAATLLSIARTGALDLETLETRNSDSLDFHDCPIWGIREVLEAAYMAGRIDAQREMSAEAVAQM